MMYSPFFSPYHRVLFDLDNTLYNEIDYLFGAYDFMGRNIQSLFPECKSEEISGFLKRVFLEEGRNELFEKCISAYGLPLDYKGSMLSAMREVQFDEKISLYPDAVNILKCALSHAEVFIITNGNLDQQINKVKQIEWHGLLENIKVVYAVSTKPKPAPDSFFSLGISPELKCLYVGDADTDEQFSMNCNIDFLHISRLRESSANG